MKIISFLLIAVLLTATACSSTKATSTTTNQTTGTAVERDGLSFETAIIAKSIHAEYEWVSKNYPGAKRQMQSLTFEEGKPYDILTFTMPDGTTQQFYFDISKFYGKGFK